MWWTFSCGNRSRAEVLRHDVAVLEDHLTAHTQPPVASNVNGARTRHVLHWLRCRGAVVAVEHVVTLTPSLGMERFTTSVNGARVRMVQPRRRQWIAVLPPAHVVRWAVALGVTLAITAVHLAWRRYDVAARLGLAIAAHLSVVPIAIALRNGVARTVVGSAFTHENRLATYRTLANVHHDVSSAKPPVI